MATDAGRAPGRTQSSGVATGLALAGAVVTTISNFGIALLLAQIGAATAGVFFAVTAIVTIVGNSACLGTMTGLVYFMPTALQGETPNPRGLLAVALRPVVLLSGAAGLVVLATAGPIGDVIARERSADAATMLRMLAVVIPAWALTVSLLGATRGLGSMTPTVAINQVFKPLAQLVLIAAVVVTSDGPSPSAIALAWGAPVVVSAVAAATAVWRLGGLTGAGTPAVTSSEFWSYSRPRAASAAFQIGLERIDVVLVSALAGEAAAGIYGTLTRYVTAGNFLIFSMAQAASPNLRRALAGYKLPEARRLLHQATGWMVALAWPYFLLVAVKSEPLARLFGDEFTEGATALTVLAVAMLAGALAGPVDLTLLMLGRSRASLVATMVALAVDVGLAWLLIPRFGLVGAAVAWAAAVVIQNGLASLLVWREERLVGPARGAMVAAVGALLAVVPVGVLTPDTFGWLVISGAIAGVIHLAWVVRFSSDLGLDVQPVARRLGVSGRAG